MTDVRVAGVGAGATGLLTALGLARAGIDVLVADTGHDSLASTGCAHDWSVLPGLHRMGVLDDALRTGFTSSRWCLHVLRTGERVDLDLGAFAPLTRFPFTVHLDYAALCRLLTRHLTGHRNVDTVGTVRLAGLAQDGDGVDLVLDETATTHRVRAHWVVGADGTHSAVRRRVGLGFPGSIWPERGVSALVEADFAALGYAATTLQLDPRYGAVVQRVGDRRWRYTFAEPSALPEDAVAERIPDILRRSVRGRCDRARMALGPHASTLRLRVPRRSSAARGRGGPCHQPHDGSEPDHRVLRRVSPGRCPFRSTRRSCRRDRPGRLCPGAQACLRRLRRADERGPPPSDPQITDRHQLEAELTYYRTAAAPPTTSGT